MLKRVIGEDIRLQCDHAPEPMYVMADAGMMDQVILNLVVNARDAMPQGGRLLITTRKASIDERRLRLHPEARVGEFVRLGVRDSGTGIPPEILARIFEPFFTTKELGKGTGLGLATVYGIVRQHGGWVEVSSRVGVGSVFKVFLPAISPPTSALRPPEARVSGRGGNERILLVEDEAALRLVTRRFLSEFGYHVIEAASGREALEIWRSQGVGIDLLLTDIVMPDGITGRELAERLRSQRPALKVIFMSGYSLNVFGNDTEFLRRDNTRFLQKPCDEQVLMDTIRRCLDEKVSSGT